MLAKNIPLAEQFIFNESSEKKQIDLFEFQKLGYFGYDNGYNYQNKSYDAYSGPFFEKNSHIVLLCNKEGSIVVHYEHDKRHEIFRGIISSQEEYTKMLMIVEKYRKKYCIKNGIDPRRDIESDLINIQNKKTIVYKELQHIPNY